MKNSSSSDEIERLHRLLAAEKLRADQGWSRYEEANRDRNALRMVIAAPFTSGSQVGCTAWHGKGYEKGCVIHHTVGVYNDGSRKENGVSSENIASHIWYNLGLRPGRAFFVDGFCLNEGYLESERCKEIEKELRANPRKMERDTAPYQ